MTTEQGISVRSDIRPDVRTYVHPTRPLPDSSPPGPNLQWSQAPIPSKLPGPSYPLPWPQSPMLQAPSPPNFKPPLKALPPPTWMDVNSPLVLQDIVPFGSAAL